MKKRFAAWMLCVSLACVAADKVLTIALGAHVYPWDSPEMAERFFTSLEDKGIDAVWSELHWRPGHWNSPEYIEYTNRTNRIIRSHGIKVLLAVGPKGLLSPEDDGTAMKAWWLDPKTGKRMEKEGTWDYASPVAMAEFMRRLEQYIEATKPYEGYIIDEVIMISCGKDADTKRMSMYWTSPTYSDAALASFRQFVGERNLLPEPEKVKFPVTTQEREPSDRWNMGLPAVPITPENSSYLIEDNDYAESPLWQAWMAWRVEVLTQFHAMQYKLAVKLLSDNPGWVGCISSAPNYWYCTETGLDKYRIAAIPELDWLISGYCSGMQLLTLKDAADKYGKKLGGMIELSRFNQREPLADRLNGFKFQVEHGAKCMYFYPLSNLNPERTEEQYINEGRGWQPSTVETWQQCVDYLRETGRAMK